MVKLGRFNINHPGKRCIFLVLNLKSKPGEIFRENVGQANALKADCTLTLSDEDMEKLVTTRNTKGGSITVPLTSCLTGLD